MTQERKNKTRFLALVLLLCGTIIFYRYRSGGSGQDIDREIFKVPELETIDRVTLQSVDHEVTLSYDGMRWKVNGMYLAESRMVTLLFATLEQMEPRRAVSANQKDAIAQAFVNQGTTVKLFHSNKLVKEFSLVGNQQKSETYFKNDDQEIYLMTIPGYRVYLAGVFELSANEWREKRIFAFNWRNFKSLGARFPNRPSDNFDVARMNNGVFGVVGVQLTDTTKLNNYLDAVSLVEANQFVEPGTQEEAIQSSEPIGILTVNDIAGNEYKLEVFQQQGKQVLLGRLNGESLLLLDRERWQPLSFGRSFFTASAQ